MKIDQDNVRKHELIGIQAKVVKSKNKSNIGIQGNILDETRETLIIGKKRLFKNNITLELRINNQEITIKGKDLLGRPKERIKK